MLMHVLLDGVELDVQIDGSARAADLAADGYWLDRRFVAPDSPLWLYEGAALTTAPPPAEPGTSNVLDIVGGLRAGTSHPLPRRRLVIGRARDCDIVLDDPTVSPHHAMLDEQGQITDLGSVNGTWIDGDLIRFGATQARIRPRHDDSRVAGPYNRPPRAQPSPPAPPPEEPPAPRRARGTGIAAVLAPALMGGALVAIYRDPRFVLLALIGPIGGLVAWIGAKRAWRKDRRSHGGAMRTYQRELAAHRERERQRLEQLAPDPCVMTRQLWMRRSQDDDFGLVRLGMKGDMPVVVTAIGGMIGIAGDHAAALALARSIVCQVAVLHGPADVRIRCEDGHDWEWAKWLPHRVAAPFTFEIAVASTTNDLPASCTAVVTMTSDLGDARLRDDESGFIACGMTEATARSRARWLARFEDPELATSATLPATVRLSELSGTRGVPIGVGADGVVDIDLVRDGPHGVIAGTTGSGKSELLRTLIAGLAMRHTPDEMVFVLVDYKGGSAFDECARFPHCVGLVTDLDEQLGERALRSLEAELRHRERVQREGGPTPPRLVVVVDEFATLATELPDFLGALVGIAQRGRSLGMHLLLATQRPSGIVNANIKANANLRIALRVQDASDSVDVIDGPEAASIDRATPGRAYIRRGTGDVTLVQTAISSLPALAERPPVVVRSFPCTDQSEPPTGRSELAILADRLQSWSGTPPRRPWLPMLDERIDLDAIERRDDFVAFAIADDPDEHRQVAAGWNPREGNLALYGMVGSGTTTAMRAIAERLTDAHIYEIDFGPDAHERHARLMRRLRTELDRRRMSGQHDPLVVTFVDNIGAFLSEHDGIDGIEVSEAFHRLFTEGPEFGIVFVVAADRANALPLRSSSSVSQKLLFRMADVHDYSMIGLRPKELPRFVPGRALASDGTHGSRVVQVGVPRRRITARTIRTLPPLVPISDLPPGAIGIDEDFEPIWLHSPDHVLVTGPPRSGKTNALQIMQRILPDHLFVDDAAQVEALTPGRPVVAAARVDDVRGSYGHWLREIRKSRTGLLLQPDLSTDGDLLGVRLPRRVSTPLRPGRGFLVENGEARLVQIASGVAGR